ncbi:MAG: hypothetical protein PHR30_08330 [Gallionellaceae bacterium]|nr:hypothetical protein [Gallionellaceae bacterium]
MKNAPVQTENESALDSANHNPNGQAERQADSARAKVVLLAEMERRAGALEHDVNEMLSEASEADADEQLAEYALDIEEAQAEVDRLRELIEAIREDDRLPFQLLQVKAAPSSRRLICPRDWKEDLNARILCPFRASDGDGDALTCWGSRCAAWKSVTADCGYCLRLDGETT